ncbi:MAG: type II toxin-antitoxin system VapC family toxin [Gammaproteobacteria bacterium]|nr:type II toxin-antitoxin system VapC family toxin [Gammaproteobacteria bacterium]
MKLLLDTHVWLWLQACPDRIEAWTLAQLEDVSNELLLSAASSWEIAIKYAIGRLPLPVPPNDYVESRMAQSGTSGLPVQHRHALQVATLPMHHRDPFDRLLVAQAQIEKTVLVTADRRMDPYDVERLSA